MPLKFTLAPSAGGKAVVDVGFTKVDFAKPAAATFDFTPAQGREGHRGRRQARSDVQARAEPAGRPRRTLGDRGKSAKDTKVIGKGWTRSPSSTPAARACRRRTPTARAAGDAQKFLDSLGDKVSGKFGSGTVFKTRLVNALMTDNGKVYVGAVTKDALVDAANAGK